MLPIDVQAEIILSFQEEKRQKFVAEQARRRARDTFHLSWRSRFLRASGNSLINAGRSLQRAAGVPLTAEFEGNRRLGWEK